MSKKDLIVVTGGAGFIGSCFLAKLNQEGMENIIVVDHMEGNFKKQNLANKKYTDYLEKEDFIEAVVKGQTPKNIKAVFHIGACSSTTEQDADYLLENNYEYTVALAEWALKDDILFYYASSAATYGDGELGYSDEDAKTPQYQPLNKYGNSKQMFDLWLIDNNLTDKVTGYKYFNVFGPNEYHKEEMRSLVVKAYQQIKASGKIKLFKSYKPKYKDGEQKRDFVYVKDVVDLMWDFYKQPNIKGIYNVGTGKARSWNDLAKAIFQALKLDPKIEYIDMPEILKDKYQYFTQADLTKLKRSKVPFNFRSLEDSVADYVVNYLEKDLAVL